MAGALASPASAAFITFDPDGPAPANGPQTIGGLDWAVGNSLAVNLAQPTVGATFQHYYQAALAGVINSAGLTIAPTGLNSSPGFEISAVMSVTERVLFTNGVGSPSETIVYQMAPVQSANSFVEIWYDTTPDANNLTGTGFNDGLQIFLGVPDPTKPAIGNYSTAADASGNNPAIELFDQFGSDDYLGKTSLVGSGGYNNENAALFQNPTFFITQVASLSFNSSTVTPFKQTNPSQRFAALAGGVPPALLPNLGTVNGLGAGAGTNDIQFQADGNGTFTPVPEPGAAVALAAAGLALAGGSRPARRR